MKNLFCVVSRNINDETKTIVCDDLITACANQLGMLVGEPNLDICKELLKVDDVQTVVDNLNNVGRDRLCNDEEEVYIFLLPSKDKMR